MEIITRVKQAGKRRGFLVDETYELEKNPSNLEELITALVRINVRNYNETNNLIDYLSTEEMEAQGRQGEISFGEQKNQNEQDVEKAVENAILSFEDGLYLVFLNEEPLEELDKSITMKSGDTVLFVKLIMLAGRLW